MEQDYNLLEKFADPDLMMNMTLGERLQATAVTGLMGLGVTFIVLICLMAIIMLLRRRISRYDMNSEYRRQVHRARKLRKAKLYKRKEEEEERHGFETVEQTMRGAGLSFCSDGASALCGGTDDEVTDEELAAVIAAAVSAYEGRPVREIRIRKISRRPYEDAAWKAGAENFNEQEGWKNR